MSRKIAYGRVVLLLLGVAVFAAVLWRGGSVTDGNTEALRILVTSFSVLAGMLIAIITVLGDPQALYPGSWRIASAHRRRIRYALFRYELLFYVYLVVIALAFAAALLGKIASDAAIARCFERVALSLGAGALVWSFGLPAAIIRARMERLDEEVNKRRAPDKELT